MAEVVRFSRALLAVLADRRLGNNACKRDDDLKVYSADDALHERLLCNILCNIQNLVVSLQIYNRVG
jgi:hypothetical protein